MVDFLPLPLYRLSLSKREERRLFPYILVACFLLVLYVQPHRPPPHLNPFSHLSSDSLFDDLPTSLSGETSPSSILTHLLPRLDRLSRQPILSYEASIAIESTRCPNTHLQSNRDQLAGEGEQYWPSVSVEELREGRERVVKRVRETFERVEEEELEEMLGKRGRGLVFTAGNKDTMSRLLTSLRILRKRHGCTLPVEIFGFPNELRGAGTVKDEIDKLGGIEWMEIESKKEEGRWKQFQIKGEAIARASFSELLYLDSDNVLLSDPAVRFSPPFRLSLTDDTIHKQVLFESPVYKEYGIVLWPDFNRDSAANPVWRLLATPCDPSYWQAETGQLLVNKRARGGMNLVALEVARAMQADSDFWFHLSGGDKDTFRYAFYFLALPYSFAPHYPSALGGYLPSTTQYKGHRFCGHTMLQFALDPSPELDGHAPPLFAHANVLKHSGYNNRRGNTFRALKKPVDDRLFPSSSSPSLHAPLPNIRQTGLPIRGICVDIWDASGLAGEAAEGASVGLYETGEVEVLDWPVEGWARIGEDLEEMYYSEGGVAGAW
ncbi:hypothetical protein JCM8547_001765 [Rhodosporidiobolus lusitaniae]